MIGMLLAEERLGWWVLQPSEEIKLEARKRSPSQPSAAASPEEKGAEGVYV